MQATNVYRSQYAQLEGEAAEQTAEQPTNLKAERLTNERLHEGVSRPLGSLAMIDGVAVAGVALAPESAYADPSMRGKVLSAVMRSTVMHAQQYEQQQEADRLRRAAQQDNMGWTKPSSTQEKSTKSKKGKKIEEEDYEVSRDIFGRLVRKPRQGTKTKNPELIRR